MHIFVCNNVFLLVSFFSDKWYRFEVAPKFSRLPRRVKLARLNVLPKTAWYTSYSDRVTSDMNRKFLKQLHR